MIIYFLRHASAGESMKDPKKDEKRALDDEGKVQCGYIGRALLAMDVHVDVILTSPLKRATQTASLVANEIGYEAKLHFDDALRPESTFEDFKDLLRSWQKHDSIMVVGHNPSLSAFVGKSISLRGEANIDLKKGAVARVDWHDKSGSLMWCLTPRAVKALYDSARSRPRPKTSRK